MFPKLSAKPNFFSLQTEITTYRKNNHIFEKSIKKNEHNETFSFFDGPPFVTGLPHYGSLLASVIKDCIPRYQTMKGKKVDRVRGWDCHGIPVEQKVQSKFNITSNRDIEEKVGIETFINECYDYTTSTSDSRERYIDNIGRRVDLKNSYKTMDNSYMESVLRVFKTLWEKGYIYKGKKVFMYSTKLGTPISNFEVAMDDTYGEVNDPAITVKFFLTDESQKKLGISKPTAILAWTTTPRTIPANLGLAVKKDLEYSVIQMDGTDEYIIIASSRIESITKNKHHTVIKTLSGLDLVGVGYTPPFEYFVGQNPVDHKVYDGDFVSDEDGTGIVHTAPEFGESDYELGKKVGLTMSETIDNEGKYTKQIPDFTGIYYSDANEPIITKLKEKNLLFDKASITHRLPFCPRTNVPLIYKALDSRMIDIQKLKPRLLELNQEINWYPGHFKDGRFAKSVESAPDWNISRSRYRGTPMPVWKSDDGEMMILGSREEIYQLSLTGSQNIEKKVIDGNTIYRDIKRDKEFDLHRPYIDEVWGIKDGKKFTRIPDVLDCWMESASMPYAQVHYPFENQEKFAKSFPGDFVAEYTGQIRAWFYVMHVIAVALFDQPPFKNVLCTGVLAGNDGRKMSKSYGNFIDPKIIIEQYGGESIRMLLANSPVVYGGDYALKDEYFLEITKSFLLPIRNTFSFFVTYAQIDQRTPPSDISLDKKNILDQRILMLSKDLINNVEQQLDTYNLTKASEYLIKYIDNVTNRYIRRSRRRFWKSEHDNDKKDAYETLYTILLTFAKVSAPFIPFFSEYIYKSLTDTLNWNNENSIHLQSRPTLDITIKDNILKTMSDVQAVVSGGLATRSKHNIRVRQPLQTLSLSQDLGVILNEMMLDELNIKEIIIDPTLTTHVTTIIKPNAKLLGQRFGSKVQEIIKEGKAGNYKKNNDGTLEIAGETLQPEECEIAYLTGERTDIFVVNDIVCALDLNITPELEIEGHARDLIRQIQELRKEADYNLADRIQITITGESITQKILSHHQDLIQEETLSTITTITGSDIQKEIEIGGEHITIKLKK